jgi:hypothetical protein
METMSGMRSYNTNIRVKERVKTKGQCRPSDNPFDRGKNIVGLDNKNRKKENKFEKLRKEIEKEKDLDIKQELKKGNIVTIIDSTLDYYY